MTEEIRAFFTGILSSVFENELVEKMNEKKVQRKKSKVEQSILDKIEASIKEEFEKNCIIEKVFKEQYYIDKQGCIFNEDDKKEFIKSFFEENKQLKYLHSSSAETVLSEYIDKINDMFFERLSVGEKTLFTAMKIEEQKQSDKLSKKMDESTNTIVSKLEDIKSEINKNSIPVLEENEKFCGGYGKRKGKCQNIINEQGELYCDECLNLKYMDKIIELYRIQKYTITVEDGYFIATLKLGILQARAIVFTIYTNKKNVDKTEIATVLENVQKIGECIEYNTIHVVTNSNISSIHKGMLRKSNVEIVTEEKIISEIMDFTMYLNKKIEEYEKNDIRKHFIDIYDENTEDLLEYSIDNFLSSSSLNAFLILGDYGCGKTSFLLDLEYKLACQYVKGGGEYIPLFIELKKYAKAIDFENLFLGFFTNECCLTNGSMETFKFLLKHKKFVLLFDGFDEVAKRVAFDVKFSVFSEICKLAIGNTKIIVTSRPNYFQEKKEYKNLIENAHLQFEPNDFNNAEFEETYIKELNPEQVKTYIDSFKEELGKYEITTEQIKSKIQEIHDLTDLMKRPFLLNIIISTLPKLISELMQEGNISSVKVNAADLYKRYTEVWLEREDSKGKTLIRKQDKLYFCKHLAYKMFLDNEYSIHFKEFPSEIKNYFSDLNRVDEIDYFSHDIQSCSFLNSDGDGYFKF